MSISYNTKDSLVSEILKATISYLLASLSVAIIWGIALFNFIVFSVVLITSLIVGSIPFIIGCFLNIILYKFTKIGKSWRFCYVTVSLFITILTYYLFKNFRHYNPQDHIYWPYDDPILASFMVGVACFVGWSKYLRLI